MRLLEHYREIHCVDFEFRALQGERPEPICLVSKEVRSGTRQRIWMHELRSMAAPPYSLGEDTLVVAYYAAAEMACHLRLRWPLPAHVLDLFTEFRTLTNGRPLPCGAGLLGAMAYFGLPCLDGAEKEAMRQLAMRGGDYSADERRALLDYCQSDVDALARMLPEMIVHVDLPRALLRGRYMKAVARMEATGVPIDVDALGALRANWQGIQRGLIDRVDDQFGVYDGRTFKAERFRRYLASQGIAWPHLESGALALDQDTFKDMARVHPELEPLRQLRHALGEMRLLDLAVGSDGRNRTMLSAFRARTGRNQPGNTRFIFGPAVWLRSLIRPPPGWGLAYIDWSQQEFGIAAALSGDRAMMQAYASGDPYLAFAKQAGAVPPHATKKTHAKIRDAFKACALAVQYGMGAQSLALRIDAPVAHARDLLRLHRRTYRTFWAWSDAAVDHAMMLGRLHTVFGWTVHTFGRVNDRSLRNFPMQANGAEMLRLACCLATEGGIRVCAPVHDALLIEAPMGDLEDAIAATQAHMRTASSLVLDGFELRSDAEIIRHPGRYIDARGSEMWKMVWSLLDPSHQRESEERAGAMDPARSRAPVPCYV